MEQVILSVDHAIITQLDFDGLPCHPSEEYSFDDCVHEEVLEKSLDELECSTPFSPDLDHICKDIEKAENASEILKSTFRKDMSEVCQYPCTFLEILPISPKVFLTSLHSGPSLRLNFKKFVTVTKSSYSYTGLEFLGEFGGYVGLFLGFSILDLSHVIEVLLFKIYHN